MHPRHVLRSGLLVIVLTKENRTKAWMIKTEIVEGRQEGGNTILVNTIYIFLETVVSPTKYNKIFEM